MRSKNSKKYIGNQAQLNSVKYIQFLEGKATGLKAYEIATASGFSITIALDRGMDITELKLDGKNISFLSATGLVNSTYFNENNDKGFLRNFNVGFLTTGGLTYMGSSDNQRGLHGTVSNTPAYNFSYKIFKDNIQVEGNIADSQMFGPNLILHRKITVYTNKTSISIDDALRNAGDETVPYMLLYHNNFGYPFLTPETKIFFQPDESCDRKYHKIKGEYPFRLKEPEMGKPEQVYFHTLRKSEYSLISPETGLSLKVKFSSKTLPVLNEWRLERNQNYVLGLEPGTNDVNGFIQANKNNKLKYIKPDEIVKFNLKFDFSEVKNEKITN